MPGERSQGSILAASGDVRVDIQKVLADPGGVFAAAGCWRGTSDKAANDTAVGCSGYLFWERSLQEWLSGNSSHPNRVRSCVLITICRRDSR